MRGASGAAGQALAVGVFAFVLGVAGSWIPSFWYDEVASVYASRRSLPDLIDLLRSTDIVHGAYYMGLHLWGEMFGFSEFSVRLPSAIAVGGAAAGGVVLASRVSSGPVALFSGILFALLPRVTWAAVEARSYALTAAAVVWLTVLLLVSLQSRARWWWVLYSLVLAMSIVLFVYLATIVAVHFLILLLHKKFRSAMLWWSGAVAASLLAIFPFLLAVLRQAGQVSWIPPLDGNLPRIVVEYQWFLGAPAFGIVFLVIVAAALFVRSGTGTGRPWRDGIVPMSLAWIIVPMVFMASYSLVRAPIYLDRYLTFTAPAVALLGGVALGRLAALRWWLPYLALGILAAALVPAYAEQRSQWAKPLQMDFSAANDFAASNVEPGDCVLFGKAAWNPSSQRLVEDVDPAAFAGTRRIGLAKDAAATGQLWDEELPLGDLAQQLSTCDVVWYFTDRERDEVENLRLSSNDEWALQPYDFEKSNDYALLSASGFRIDERVTFHVTQAVRLVR